MQRQTEYRHFLQSVCVCVLFLLRCCQYVWMKSADELTESLCSWHKPVSCCRHRPGRVWMLEPTTNEASGVYYVSIVMATLQDQSCHRAEHKSTVQLSGGTKQTSWTKPLMHTLSQEKPVYSRNVKRKSLTDVVPQVLWEAAWRNFQEWWKEKWAGSNNDVGVMIDERKIWRRQRGAIAEGQLCAYASLAGWHCAWKWVLLKALSMLVLRKETGRIYLILSIGMFHDNM